MSYKTRQVSESDLLRCLISPNECDRNLEPANVVDALFAIARALNRVADALKGKTEGLFGFERA